MLQKLKKRGRPLSDRRKIIETIFYILKGSVQWRMLPSEFSPWQTVYHVFRKWNKENVWDALNNQFRALARDAHGKRSRPTAAILNSQSVKSDPQGGSVSNDARKRIKG
jgi:putative transposase